MLRLTDVYLAISTLGFGEVVRILIVLLPGLTGGPTGANLSTGFPYDTMKRPETLALVIFLAVFGYLFQTLYGSRTGRALRAMRENPRAASAMGIDITYHKNLLFVLSALIAGAAGAFYAHSVGSLDNGDFRFTRAVNILGYAVVGGAGQWYGPLLGAGLLTALPILIRDGLGASVGFLANFAQLPDILTGIALMAVILFLPGWHRVHVRWARWRGTVRHGPTWVEHAPLGGHPAPGRAGFTIRGAGFRATRPGTRGPLLRRRGRRKRRELLRPARTDLWAHRSEWRGEDNPAGPGFGPGGTQLGPHPLAGTGDPARSSAPDRPAGVARTFQGIQLFSDMSVLENVLVGRHGHIRTTLFSAWLRLPRSRREEREAREHAVSLLSRVSLADMADRRAGGLSYGDQRRVEIARALAAAPRLVLLDEPAAGHERGRGGPAR